MIDDLFALAAGGFGHAVGAETVKIDMYDVIILVRIGGIRNAVAFQRADLMPDGFAEPRLLELLLKFGIQKHFHM